MFHKRLLQLIIVSTSTLVWGRLNSESYDQSYSNNETTTVVTIMDDFDTEQQQQRSLIKISEPTFFGSGCESPNSARISIPSFAVGGQAKIKVIFTEYEARTSNSVLRDYKSCNMALPMQIDAGVSIGIMKVDYYGYAIVPRGSGEARFDAEYFFSGFQGPTTSKTFGASAAGFNGKIHESDVIEASITWSPCGGDSGGATNFRINTSLLASKDKANDPNVLITMDRAQVDGFDFFFKTKRC